MILLIFTVLFCTVVVYLWIYLKKVYSKFSKHGVNTIRPVPIFGNVHSLAFKRRHVAEDVQILYNTFPNDRFVGRYELTRPVLVVRDLELAKKVAIKDFDHFTDHSSFVDETVDPLFARNLLALKGQEWRDMRSTLSAAFTSSKMKAMVPFMLEASKQMVKHLKGRLEDSRSNSFEIDSKDMITRTTNDVIASCAFGLKLDSHSEPYNEFYLNAKTTAHFGFRRILLYLGHSSFPAIMKILNIKFYQENANKYFQKIFFDTMLERKTKNIMRPDMIHLLLEAKKGTLKHDKADKPQDAGFADEEETTIEGKRTLNKSWTDTDLIAQALLFFLAGFESVASAMCFLLYELALHPEVQTKLAEEIRENERKRGFDYNTVQDLQYMDMVVSELLRLWPFGVGQERVCTRDYNLGRPNSEAKEDYRIRKGEAIFVPIWSIQRDPNYFHDPEKFDPERFSEENRLKIRPNTYMPFGVGPRHCIGSRFTLYEMKVMLYQLMLHFEVSPAENTRVPAKLVPGAFTLAMEGGHWLTFRQRI